MSQGHRAAFSNLTNLNSDNNGPPIDQQKGLQFGYRMSPTVLVELLGETVEPLGGEYVSGN